MLRFALILGGYALAVAAGLTAVWLKNLGVSEADQLAMSGMYAFGDAVAFLAVASAGAIIPTVFGVKLLAPAPRLWRAYAFGSLAIAGTGWLAAALLYFPQTRSELLATLAMVAPLRVLSAPFFCLAFVPGLVPKASRKVALLALAFEGCTGGSFIVWVLLQRHFEP